MCLDPQIADLAATLAEMSVLLRACGDEFWAAHLDRCRVRLERSDFRGVVILRELFGGMSSLNDVVLQRDGRMPVADNDRFDLLRGKAGDLCGRFIREDWDS